MNCTTFESRLQSLLDERLRPQADNDLLMHADGCAECSHMLAGYELLWDGLELAEPPAMSADFTQRVVGLAEPASLPRQVWSAPVRALATVAALILIALAPLTRSLWSPSTKSADEHPVAAASGPLPADSSVKPARPSSSDAAQVPQIEAIHSVASDAASEHLAQSPALPPSTDPAPPGNTSNLEWLIAEIPSRLSEVSVENFDTEKIPGMRPLASSFHVTITLLRRSLLGGKDQNPEKPQAILALPATLPVVS